MFCAKGEGFTVDYKVSLLLIDSLVIYLYWNWVHYIQNLLSKTPFYYKLSLTHRYPSLHLFSISCTPRTKPYVYEEGSVCECSRYLPPSSIVTLNFLGNVLLFTIQNLENLSKTQIGEKKSKLRCNFGLELTNLSHNRRGTRHTWGSLSRKCVVVLIERFSV